jgi:hypothetical protein
MRPITNKKLQHAALRCVWVPAYPGANAPLTAVWIETAQSYTTTNDNSGLSSDGPGSWLFAA